MNTRNPRVDFYFSKTPKWQQALEHLRAIVLACGLTEELTWGVPCYTLQQRNVVLLHAFKDYCALLFINGALLPDPQGVLIQQTERVQAARQIRFGSAQEAAELAPVVRAYLEQAIEAEKAGLRVARKKPAEVDVPAEFYHELAGNAGLKKAFYALTPGRQRAYLLHFAQPKQATTRQARIEKWRPHIMSGKGLHE